MTEHSEEPTIEELRERLDSQRGVNVQHVLALKRGGANLSSDSVLSQRIEALITLLLGEEETSISRVALELLFEQNMTTLLQQAQVQLAQEMLKPPPGIVLPPNIKG